MSHKFSHSRASTHIALGTVRHKREISEQLRENKDADK